MKRHFEIDDLLAHFVTSLLKSLFDSYLELCFCSLQLHPSNIWLCFYQNYASTKQPEKASIRDPTHTTFSRQIRRTMPNPLCSHDVMCTTFAFSLFAAPKLFICIHVRNLIIWGIVYGVENRQVGRLWTVVALICGTFLFVWFIKHVFILFCF